MIRAARPSDAAAMLEIYGPIVRDTATSFEKDMPTVAEFAARIEKTLRNYPWLVMEKDGIVAGYAYAGEYRARHAYLWSVSSSVYIHPRYQRQGIGLALYRRLFDILRKQGYYNVFAGATLPNEGSVALHEKAGFTAIGTGKSEGFKLGRWHDVIRWQLNLQPYSAPSSDPIPFSQLREAA